MKPSELRINNLYYSTKFTKIVRCELSDFAQLYALCDGSQLDSDIISQVFEPILLAPKFIKKLKLKQGISVHNDSFSGIVFIEYNEFIGNFEFCIGRVSISTIDYVHELQNIFYSLTGTELEISEKMYKYL